MLPKFTGTFMRCHLFEERRTNVHDDGGKSEHNTSWKSSLYNFRTAPRVSTRFKISDLWYCVREARLQKTVCQMGAENVNRQTQAVTPGCSSSIFATPPNWRRSVFWPYCHWRWDVVFLHKHRVKATVNTMAPLIVPESKEVQASIFSQKNHGHRFLGQKGNLVYWFSRTWIDN